MASLEQALLYLIRVLDPVADTDYSVVYFCTRSENIERPIPYFRKAAVADYMKNLLLVNTFEAAYSLFRTSSENMISYWWMKEIYAKLPYHYKKNLKDFYTVHPSMWTRLTSWWFTTFMAPAIKQKLHNVYEVTEIINYGKIGIYLFISGETVGQHHTLHRV